MKYLISTIALFIILASSSTAQIINRSFTNKTPHKVVKLKENDFFSEHAKNVILLIGDGMGVDQVFAALTANRGVLNMTQMPFTGFSLTQSADRYITGSAAGATAISTGQRTYNSAIGVDTNRMAIPTILEISKSKGYATGLVATSSITHATPASFIAHQPSRSMEEEIAADFIDSGIDVFIGGGRKYFNARKDKRNLLKELMYDNYLVFNSLAEASNANQLKLVILTANKQNKTYPKRGDMLPEATEKAIEVLKNNEKGFFLMVEGSMIDWGGHRNNTKYVVQETLDFDRAIGKALEFASSNKETLVIITADHETGGMSIASGNIEKGKVKADFTTIGHTAVMVPVFAYGAGAYKFTGVYKNSDIFNKMMESFGF